MNINNYTNNLKEKVRIDIGKMLISHELNKLLPDWDYENIKGQINSRWKDFSDIVAVRDFWNLVDSLMMGYKLKDIIRLVTSSQIDWGLTQLKIEDLRFASDIAEIEGFDIRTKTAKDVSTYLYEHKDRFEIVKEKTQIEVAKASSRTMDPIVVEKYTDGTLHVHDGNLRLLKAIIEKRDTIDAYIGTHNGSSKLDHWVSTSYLMRLSDERQKELLVKLLRESDNAVFEFKNRVNSEERFKQEVLNALNIS